MEYSGMEQPAPARAPSSASSRRHATRFVRPAIAHLPVKAPARPPAGARGTRRLVPFRPGVRHRWTFPGGGKTPPAPATRGVAVAATGQRRQAGEETPAAAVAERTPPTPT